MCIYDSVVNNVNSDAFTIGVSHSDLSARHAAVDPGTACTVSGTYSQSECGLNFNPQNLTYFTLGEQLAIVEPSRDLVLEHDNFKPDRAIAENETNVSVDTEHNCDTKDSNYEVIENRVQYQSGKCTFQMELTMLFGP